ncbi:MAG: hypothetical protein P8O70_11015 [SAR324 cluster bacterium]|nr:hypothetical protein [SAR324 cluster bacterium]
MQATEQITTLDAEKEWKILNQLAEIAADIENQTSYYSFQLEDGSPISDTLLVDVNSWISQLQSLVPNTNPQEVVPVVLPNLEPTASTSASQKESAEASSVDDKEIDEEFLKDPSTEENGADSSTYLGAVAEAVAQELQGNSTAGFENAEALDGEESDEDDEENPESTDPIDENDEELGSINQAIEHAEQIEAQSVQRVQLNSELEDERESNLDEVEEEIEEEEAESWFQEELAEEEQALSLKDSGEEEIQPESLLLQETTEPSQVEKSEGEELIEDNIEGSETELGTTEAKENLGKVEASEVVIPDLSDPTNELVEAQSVTPEESIEDDKLVLSRMPDDANPADEPIIDDDYESLKASGSSENLVTEDTNEPLEILTPSEVELLASEALHGGVIDQEDESEDVEDLVVELDLESENDLTEEDSDNLAIEDDNEIVTPLTTDSDHSDQPTPEHEEVDQDLTPESYPAEIENAKLEGETSDSSEFDSELNSKELNDESSEIDDLQEISVEEDQVEEDRDEPQIENSEDVLTEDPVAEKALESSDTQTSQTTNSDELGGSVNAEENSENPENETEKFSYGNDHQNEEAHEVKSDQEISQEAMDLNKFEPLESSNPTMVLPEKVSEPSSEGVENSTDPQNEQSAANLDFLQERYNRIANAALEEGKLELAKDCYDSLAKILRLMK